MKSYEIWLKGGGSLNDVMTDEDALELKRAKQTKCDSVFNYTDEDGDDTTIEVNQIAVFAFRDVEDDKEIGF